MAEPLEALAKRVESEPFFLASVLAAYARSEALDDAGLAAALGCRAEDLVMVRLCRAPRTAADEFWEDVTRVAEHFDMEPQRLAEAVKRGQVVQRLQAGEPSGARFLAAARDHDEPPPEGPCKSPSG
jgi:hypothetical protein